MSTELLGTRAARDFSMKYVASSTRSTGVMGTAAALSASIAKMATVYSYEATRCYNRNVYPVPPLHGRVCRTIESIKDGVPQS